MALIASDLNLNLITLNNRGRMNSADIGAETSLTSSATSARWAIHAFFISVPSMVITPFSNKYCDISDKNIKSDKLKRLNTQ
nr:hypothetical protein [Xenorhabdus sp. ZM]